MRFKSKGAIGILVSTSVVLAAGRLAWASDAPTTQPVPATQPVSPEIAALILQLGDDDFHIRRSASAKLEALGKAAIPALQEARKSPDPEVHTRAEVILAGIDHPYAGPVPQPSAFGNQSVRTSFFNGKKRTDIREPGRLTHIEENASGIKMQVAGQIGGKPVTREYQAKNPDELKKNAPDAYALYRQFNEAGEQIQIMGQGGQVIVRRNGQANWGQLLVQQNPVPPAPQPNLQGDNINQLESRLQKQMEDAKTPDAQREEVNALLKKIRDVPAPADPADPDAGMREYNRSCDALRQKLADLKLPDPGDALPPSAANRLGISAEEEVAGGLGLIVTHVQADSRAAKLGLKDHDVIQKVNQQVIHSTQALRKIVVDNPKGLVVEGLRDGKEFKLEEKP